MDRRFKSPEELVRAVFRLGYELAKEDLEFNAYDPDQATAHCVDLHACRRAIISMKLDRGLIDLVGDTLDSDIEVDLPSKDKPPRCPECGGEMLDETDGMYGGWFCANKHRAIIIPGR